MSDKPLVLVIDDDPSFCSLLKSFLSKNDYKVEEAHTAREGLRAVYDHNFDLVLIDYRLPDLDGLELLKNIKKKYFHLPVIIMTNYANIRTAVDAMKLGAFEYVTKPINPDEILLTIGNALKSVHENSSSPNAKEAEKPKSPSPSFRFVEGNSPLAKQVKKHIDLVGPTNLSVIVQGESGTGKEYVSRKIHEKSERRKKPFVALDCGALSEDLAGSELFGHLKGSFTGALQDKMGQFQAANGGTLFLDEIGNLSYDIQVKLLRAIQERTIRQIGSNKNLDVDVRLIVATNENLDQAVKEGEFREDLYHRLNEFQIKVPALRERKADIPEFVDHFLNQSNHELGKEVKGIEPEVLEKLEEYHWPGNIRELKNVIRRAVLLTTGEKMSLETLPPEIISPVSNEMEQQNHTSSVNPHNPDLKAIQEKTEKALIEETLIKVKYNKTLAAKMLNIDRKTLYNKLKRYNLD
ncbi:two-component system response regulator HydG [Catalinimonas alkaloidigena]|uniref:sigma-54-dependent transcriptional regulator n=1 Tax=Catalinimonas alkaloidigena TaxID=1075417 RepID=UPI00240503F1|nr:sigma-54 dependent transcriptional regulator [Catalinimonas alkaloidigena]MDF9795899.1 two-component system response regulator HydG [Catalinimonas alkaloidigena]